MGMVGPIQVFSSMIDYSILLQNQLVSVRRILDYTNLPSEEDLEDTINPQQDGIGELINKGKIEFRNVCLSYELSKEQALKGVSFIVPGRSKVGVVGRTGAGKSSILQALFRLTEIDKNGSIFIDGIDIRTVSLHRLRSSLSYIP